jgi:hypothetical protein
MIMNGRFGRCSLPPRWGLLASLPIAAGLLGASCGDASAICDTRHFYNNSDTTWQLNFTPGSPGTCRPAGGPDGSSCDIKPGTVAGLSYPELGGWSFRIRSAKYNYDTTLGYSGFGGCYIGHSGGTGIIAVNDPADGDVNTCGKPDWPCQ